MIPCNIESSWYRTYWFDPPPRDTEQAWWTLDRAHGARRRDWALLGFVLLVAAMAIGAVLITALAPVPPADLPYFVT